MAFMLSSMPRNHLFAGFVMLCLFSGNRLSPAMEDLAVNPAPVDTSSIAQPNDGSENRKPFIITATLREGYDDNIFTAKTNKVSSFTTDIEPSILFDFPMDSSDFSLRFSAGLTFYYNRNGGSADKTAEMVLRYNHSFSDRFNIDVRDRVGYYSEPSVLTGGGSLYRDGGYVNNLATVDFTAQWTPLFGTVTTYSNSLYDYQNSAIAAGQSSDENIGSEDFRFAILPKINLVFGGIIDNITYDTAHRGYTNFTADTGIDWQALPSLSIGGRVGATFADPEGTDSSVSPYGAATVNWRLGARSTLDFNYEHDVVPTDFLTAAGQEADRFTLRFSYDITPSLTVHAQGIVTHGVYNQDLIQGNAVPNFSEEDYGLDTGFSYHFNSHFDFDAGYTFSAISSQEGFRDYTRNQFYVGVRGTY